MQVSAHGVPWAAPFYAPDWTCSVCLRLGGTDSGEFDFDAAVLGVVVIADFVGYVDEAAGLELQVHAAAGPVPSHAAHGGGAGGEAMVLLTKFERDVTVFHHAGRGHDADSAGGEDGLGIAMAERLQPGEPSSEHRSDAVERELGVDAQQQFGLARGEAFGGVGGESALELGKGTGRHGEADGKGVAAEAGEQVGAGFDGFEQRESIDGATGAVGDWTLGRVFHVDDDRGLGGALDHARGEDADDAAMPAVAVDDEQAAGGKFGVLRKACFDCGERGSFGLAALAIEQLEIGGEFERTGAVARGKELNDLRGDVHAAGGVDARGQAEGDVEAGERLGCGIERGHLKERAQARADGTAQLANPERGDGAVLAAQWNGIGDGGDGSHFEKAGQRLFAGARGIAGLKERLRQFERDSCAAEGLFRIAAAGLIGIQDGQRVGDAIVGGGEVVVGDDEIEAEAARGFRFGKGAHAGVDGDDEAHAIGVCRLQHAGLESVAFAEAMRHVETDHDHQASRWQF